jgi:hypothetical protein
MPLEDDDRKRIVQTIRTYIARERISREEFAQRAKLGKSTVDKLVVGNFSEKTVLQIETQLQIKLLEVPAGGTPAGEAAGEEFGKYTREDTKNYIGNYVYARPSFAGDGCISAFNLEIVWDHGASHLVVREVGRGQALPPQFGRIYIPRASRHLFILSNEQGWLKKVILSQIDVTRRMKGIMLTMGHAVANVYLPVAMPVIMNKYDKIDAGMLGKIDRSSRMFKDYSADLMSVEQDQFARWVGAKPA